VQELIFVNVYTLRVLTCSNAMSISSVPMNSANTLTHVWDYMPLIFREANLVINALLMGGAASVRVVRYTACIKMTSGLEVDYIHKYGERNYKH
jgi:hypothetical protein